MAKRKAGMGLDELQRTCAALDIHSGAALARALHVSPPTGQRWLNGDASMPWAEATLLRLALKLKMSPDRLDAIATS